MKRALLKVCSGVGILFGIISALMWILSAKAQQFGLDPTQARISGAWNAQSADFNYFAAVLTAAAATLVGIAVFFGD